MSGLPYLYNNQHRVKPLRITQNLCDIPKGCAKGVCLPYNLPPIANQQPKTKLTNNPHKEPC